MSPNLNTIERRVRTLNGQYFLQREVAEALSCSVGLLVKLRQEDPQKYGPSFAIEWRQDLVYLFTFDDVRRLQMHLAERWPHLAVDPSPGVPFVPGKSLAWRPRPRLFDDDERQERQRRHTRAGYWRTRSLAYARRGQHEQAELAAARCAAIRQRLRFELEGRRGGDRHEVPDICLVVT